MSFPLEIADPSSLGFDVVQLSKLERMILQHIDEGRYPGAQFALARHGKLAAFKSYGNARTEPEFDPDRPGYSLPTVLQHEGAGEFCRMASH